MDTKDWMAIAYIQDLKNQHEAEISRTQRESDLEFIEHARNNRKKRERQQAQHEEAIYNIQQEHFIKLKALQSQVNFLVTELKRKNDLIAQYLPPNVLAELRYQEELKQAESIVENYLFLDDFLTSLPKELNDDDVVSDKSIKEWKILFQDLRKNMPSGEMLDKIIEKLSSKS